MPPVLQFYRTLPLGGSPPPKAPKGARSTPPLLFDTTAKYRKQDELFLRSATLKMYLSLRLKTACLSHTSGLPGPL